MSISTEELMSMIDYLPIDIKTQLVERILTSLQPIQKDIDAFWAEEAEKRINEIKEKKLTQVCQNNRIFIKNLVDFVVQNVIICWNY